MFFTLLNIFLQSSQVNFNSWAIGGLYLLLIFIALYITNTFSKLKNVLIKDPVQNYFSIEAKLKSVDLNVNAIINCDEKGLILTWNKGASKIFGWEEHQVIGKCISIILPERDKEKYKKAIFEFRDTGFSEVFDKPVKTLGYTKAKKEVNIELNLSQWKNDGHIFFTAIVIDITEQKKADAEMDKLLTLYKESEILECFGAWKWNLITNVVTTTQGFRDIYEMSSKSRESYDDAIRRVHYEDKAFVEEKIREGIKNKADYSMEYRIIGKDGRIKKVKNKSKVWIGATGVEKIFGVVKEIKE